MIATVSKKAVTLGIEGSGGRQLRRGDTFDLHKTANGYYEVFTTDGEHVGTLSERLAAAWFVFRDFRE